ncbi:hypothetical protein D3C87_1114600 [compost metagenome]
MIAAILRVTNRLLDILMPFAADDLVGIQNQDPVPRGMRQGLVARGGEIPCPGKVEDLGAEALGNLAGAIGGAGIDQDDLVDEPAHAGKAIPEEMLLILGDHTKAQRRILDFEQGHDRVELRRHGSLSATLALAGLDEVRLGNRMLGVELQGTSEEGLSRRPELQLEEGVPHRIVDIHFIGSQFKAALEGDDRLVHLALLEEDRPYLQVQPGILIILLKRRKEVSDGVVQIS